MDFNKVPTPEEAEALTDSETEMQLIADIADEMVAKRGSRDHFPIGFDVFNNTMEGGITDGDLVIVSGPSGHGKTTFAQTITYHLSQVGIPVAWFSYEIPIDELWRKFEEMKIERKMFNGYAPKKLASGNVKWISDRILETILKHRTKVVFIDHLGFLTPFIDEKNAREFERNFSAYLGQLTRQLKSLAMENDITIVLLAHTRKTKEDLQIDDIAHSIGIAQEADFVFMVEREKLKARKLGDVTAGDTFGPHSKISMVKNRRTGQNKFIKAEFKNGKLQEIPPPIVNTYDTYIT